MNSHEVKATVRIGKQGLTEAQVMELRKQLKNKKMIKIKLLKSFRDADKKDAVNEIARKTNSEIVSFVGFTAVLKKKYFNKQ